MAHLIDKDALVAELNKRITDAPINNIGHQRVWAYNDVKDIIKTLEVKEPVSEDLEKEVDSFLDDPVFGNLINRNAGIALARHFAQWSLEQVKKSDISQPVAETCKEKVDFLTEEDLEKAALVAEIERRTDELWALIPDGEKVISDKHTKEDAFNLGKYTALESFGKFIDTLEVKEVDLESEMDKYFETMEVLEHEYIFEDTFQMIAKHFFELGLKAKQG